METTHPASNGGLCCTVRETGRLRFQIGMEGNQMRPKLRNLTYESQREWWGPCETFPTQGKQLYQQSITANRRKNETAEPCSRENGGTSKHGPGRLESPPRGRGGNKSAHPRCDGDSRNSFAKGNHRKANFHNAHQVPSWAVDWRSHRRS